MKRVIVVHGGAGRIPNEERAGRHQGCREAALAGWDILARGGSALNAVEHAVAFLEDHPLFNAGRGSVLNALGEVEMDASLMDGRALRAGAVGAVRNVRNPIRLARRIFEDGQQVLLVGEGADRFVHESGLEVCAPEQLVTERQRERWRARREEGSGTVGAVAVDAAGGVSAATSTGGLFGKRPGRVGDSALIGSGTYADQSLGAASATGNGEAIIRTVLTKTAVDLLRGDRHPEEAATVAIAVLEQRGQGEGGIIIVDRQGRTGCAHNTSFMPCAVMHETIETPTLLS
ncbi:MAG: isoaspartyl peptidase/L-asparaginase family protein [Candidatus Methylomirabilales bacterium]